MHNITSYDSFYNEDETYFTKNGCLTRRSLGIVGQECIVTEPTSHKDGFMFLTTVSHSRGVVFYHFKPSTESQWRDVRNHYKVELLQPRVYSILVNPSGKTSQVTFLNTVSQIHRVVPPGEPTELVDYDNAGPHAGQLIERAFKSIGKVPTHGPMGGGTDVDQIADAKQIHGSLKEFVRRKSRRKFLEDSKRLHRENLKVKPPGLSLTILAVWMSEWAQAHGEPEDVHNLFQQYFPPPIGKPDLRKEEIKLHEAAYFLLGDPPPRKKSRTRNELPLTALKQIGKARAKAITELTGFVTIGDIANADEAALNAFEVKGVNLVRKHLEAKQMLRSREQPSSARVYCDRCNQSWASKTKAYKAHVKDWDSNLKCFFRSERPFFGKLVSQPITDNIKEYRGRLFEYSTADEPGSRKLAMCTRDPGVYTLLDTNQSIFRGKWHELATGNEFRWVNQHV